jgi:hypothetical protein
MSNRTPVRGATYKDARRFRGHGFARRFSHRWRRDGKLDIAARCGVVTLRRIGAATAFPLGSEIRKVKEAHLAKGMPLYLFFATGLLEAIS